MLDLTQSTTNDPEQMEEFHADCACNGNATKRKTRKNFISSSLMCAAFPREPPSNSTGRGQGSLGYALGSKMVPVLIPHVASFCTRVAKNAPERVLGPQRSRGTRGHECAEVPGSVQYEVVQTLEALRDIQVSRDKCARNQLTTSMWKESPSGRARATPDLADCA